MSGDHSHAASAGHPHGREPALPPSGQGTVVLDIGDGVGALVVHTPAAREVDQGMWRGLVGEALAHGAGVRCETHDCLSAESPCRIVIELSA